MKQQKGDNIKHFSYFGGKILPNSYQFLENCQNSDDFRKIRPRYAQCMKYNNQNYIWFFIHIYYFLTTVKLKKLIINISE